MGNEKFYMKARESEGSGLQGEARRGSVGLHKGIKAKEITSDEGPREKLFWEAEEGDI